MKKIILLFCLVPLLGACTVVRTNLRTSVSSSAPRIRYQRIAVEVLNANGTRNIQGEWAFRDKFSNGYSQAIPASDLIREGTALTLEQRAKIYQKNKLQGVLTIRLSPMKDQVSYLGSQRSTYYSRGRHGRVYVSSYEYPMYDESTVQKQEVRLYDLKSMRPIWLGDGLTYANYASQDIQTFMNSLADEIIKKLTLDGMI